MNNKMFSVVIRNKNESEALDNTLKILNKLYKNYIFEIIVVAKNYNCRVINIQNFSYGAAINIGINASNCKFILLLSSHCIPIGDSFFQKFFPLIKTE